MDGRNLGDRIGEYKQAEAGSHSALTGVLSTLYTSEGFLTGNIGFRMTHRGPGAVPPHMEPNTTFLGRNTLTRVMSPNVGQSDQLPQGPDLQRARGPPPIADGSTYSGIAHGDTGRGNEAQVVVHRTVREQLALARSGHQHFDGAYILCGICNRPSSEPKWCAECHTLGHVSCLNIQEIH